MLVSHLVYKAKKKYKYLVNLISNLYVIFCEFNVNLA